MTGANKRPALWLLQQLHGRQLRVHPRHRGKVPIAQSVCSSGHPYRVRALCCYRSDECPTAVQCVACLRWVCVVPCGGTGVTMDGPAPGPRSAH